MLHHSQKNVNDEIKEEFLPRPDKYKDLINSKQIPTTNESLIVIPCLTKTYGFKTNQYKVNQKILKGVITEAEFNGFMRRANNIIDSELISKSTKENEPFFKIISTLLKISIMLSALALMLFAVIVYSTLDPVVYTIVFDSSVVLLCLSGLIAFLCPISLYRQKYTSLNYEKIIGERLRQLESEQNKLNASRKANHIIWRIQKNFYWVELHINRIMLEKGISIQMET